MLTTRKEKQKKKQTITNNLKLKEHHQQTKQNKNVICFYTCTQKYVRTMFDCTASKIYRTKVHLNSRRKKKTFLPI